MASLGAGYFAQFQLEAWTRIGGAELCGIADLDPERAAAVASAYGTKSFPNLDALLSVTDADILDIAVPPPGHADAIRTALSAGVKAIICQKPFCGSLAEAEEVTALAAKSEIPLIVHENFRWQPWYRVMAEAIVDGRIGPPQNLTFRLRTGDGQGGRAYLDRQPYFQKMSRFLIHETGVHWIDVFRYLMGSDPVDVYADIRRLNPAIAGEDAGHIVFGFENGARALFDGNRLLDHAAKNTRLTLGEALVEGPNGALSLNGYGEVAFRAFGGYETEVLLPAKDWPGFGGDCVFALQSHVVDGLANGRNFENSASDYLAVRRVEEAAYQSAEVGRKITLGLDTR